jgi:poly(beta-D-mannuronate) lyase
MMKTAVALFVLLAAMPLAHAQCPEPPPPVRDLNLTRFYADRTGSIVDPAKMEAHKTETAPLTEFVGFITKLADKTWQQRSGPQGTISCELTWLKAWANGGAYLGKMDSAQSESQRKWDLAGTALAYLKIRRWAEPDDRAIIEPWLTTWADKARAVFDDPSVKRNNHWYWLGLALGATGLATDSDTHWQMAKGIMADAANDIAADGTLPLELAREGRALHYHAFAVMALVTLAELGGAKGEDWYALSNGALHRLVARTGRQPPRAASETVCRLGRAL